MAGQDTEIPIIDCSDIGLNVKEENIFVENVKNLGDRLRNALGSLGVCYLKNHGVDKNLIDGYMASSLKFFYQPMEEKIKYKHQTDLNSGWLGMQHEGLNRRSPGDLKEAFLYCFGNGVCPWPNEDMQHYGTQLYESSKALALRLCDCLSIGLGFERKFLAKAHKAIGSLGNLSALSTLYYPPISREYVIKPGQIRHTEHTDFGTFTLLYQDNMGGLEVEFPGKGYVPVAPIPETIVINISDMLQRLTAGAVVACKHRVVVPESELLRGKPRQSIAFFVNPDDRYEIRKQDGSKPLTSIDYLVNRLENEL